MLYNLFPNRHFSNRNNAKNSLENGNGKKLIIDINQNFKFYELKHSAKEENSKKNPPSGISCAASISRKRMWNERKKCEQEHTPKKYFFENLSVARYLFRHSVSSRKFQVLGHFRYNWSANIDSNHMHFVT
jgi:hypothetical protein